MNPYIQAGTFSIALLGAVLGIINTIYGIRRDKMKLSIRAVFATIHLSDGSMMPQQVGVEVINLSSFPVTINETGFTVRGKKERMAILNPVFYDGKSLPRRLEARDSFTAYANAKVLQHPDFENIKKTYVKTGCGKMITGRPPASL